MTEISRVVRRRAKPGCDKAYEDLVRAMLERASHFPGALSAAVIPPRAEGGEFQIIQRFASTADLERWQSSDDSALWHERLAAVAEDDPDYHLLTGLEVWFAPKLVPTGAKPLRWRMAVVTWTAIFPLASLSLWGLAPLVAPLPYLGRMAIITAVVVAAMTYVVMPRLSRWLAWWVAPKEKSRHPG